MEKGRAVREFSFWYLSHLSKGFPLHGRVPLSLFRLLSCALMLEEAVERFWQLLGAFVLSSIKCSAREGVAGCWAGAGGSCC